MLVSSPARKPAPMVAESHDIEALLHSILLVVFAYVGFEAALIRAGEAKSADRDAPFAILAALGICTPIYVLVQFVVVQTLTTPAGSDHPLAAAARIFGGAVLAKMIACGVLLSVVGFLAAAMIVTPRIVFAFAEQGDFPRWFAAVHPAIKLRTSPSLCMRSWYGRWQCWARSAGMQSFRLFPA